MPYLKHITFLPIFSFIVCLGSVSAQENIEQNEDKKSDEEYVISATRLGTPSYKLGSSVTVVTAKEIEAMNVNSVIDVLRSVEGIDTVRSGGLGGNTAVFMRGANSEHTLVLVDGIELNNPISTNRSFNFADLSLDNVERIEIIRGPQSTLYGSDALGGVINIITKKGSGKPEGSASVEAGSYSTILEKAASSGANEKINYSVSASREDSSGISSAGAKYGNTEHDGYENTAVSARIGAKLVEAADLNLYFRRTDARSDLDNQGGFGGDDPNRILMNDTTLLKGESNIAWEKNVFEQKLAVSWTEHDLTDNNDPDLSHPLDRLRSNYSGDLIKYELQNNLFLAEAGTIVFGFEEEHEEGHSGLRSTSEFGPFDSFFPEQDSRNHAYYLQHQISIGDSFFSTIGGRVDDPTGFDPEFTWRIAPTYLIKETGSRLKGTYGTGFKAPSLFQRYSEFGNLDLDSEKSDGWDIGVEQQLLKNQVRMGVTYFHNSFDNLITFDPDSFIFSNIASAKSSGFETFTELELSEELVSRVAYTYTDTEDETTGLSLLRRPRNKLSFQVTEKFCEDYSVQMEYQLVGNRFDNDFSTFPATRVQLGAYGIMNISGQVDVSENLHLFLRAENVFDKEYEEVYGFGTLGASIYGGIKVNT